MARTSLPRDAGIGVGGLLPATLRTTLAGLFCGAAAFLRSHLS